MSIHYEITVFSSEMYHSLGLPKNESLPRYSRINEEVLNLILEKQPFILESGATCRETVVESVAKTLIVINSIYLNNMSHIKFSIRNYDLPYQLVDWMNLELFPILRGSYNYIIDDVTEEDYNYCFTIASPTFQTGVASLVLFFLKYGDSVEFEYGYDTDGIIKAILEWRSDTGDVESTDVYYTAFGLFLIMNCIAYDLTSFAKTGYGIEYTGIGDICLRSCLISNTKQLLEFHEKYNKANQYMYVEKAIIEYRKNNPERVVYNEW